MKKGYTPIEHEPPGEKDLLYGGHSTRERMDVIYRLRRWCNMTYGDGSREPLLQIREKRRKHSINTPRIFRLVTGALFVSFSALLLSRFIPFGTVLSSDALYTQDFSEIIKSVPSSESIREFFHVFASEPHVAGSSVDKRQAEWTRDKLTEFGIENVTIETYYPWLNLPTTRRLAIVDGPQDLRFEATLREDPVSKDPSSLRHDVTPTFHGYSFDGNVTGPVVYVNYGRIVDFQYLATHGVNLTGTIALMRHGLIARGLKVQNAEMFGCIGALLYSDPMDDGPFDKDPEQDGASYPDGPWRSPTSVERGTVQYTSILPGDPLTPGYPATENATRLTPSEAYALPRIPSLPISWSDALPLFKATEGLGLPATPDWLGGLCQVNYFSGPSVALVNLVNINNYSVNPVWNVIGRIQGTEEPDRVIILGTHRDAWGFGGADAASGSAILVELARVFGIMMERGWRPRRTILLASWDAQEYGMVGSTEWAEEHQDWLHKEAVAYLNVEQAVTGSHLSVQASPLLHDLVHQVTKEIIDPHTSLPLYTAWKQYRETLNAQKHSHKKTPQHPSSDPVVEKLVDPLGGGTDSMAFFNHIGIASLSMRFVGSYGVYHSNYDSIYWMERFGDPTYEYHQTMTKLWGLLALRLADDALLPLSPTEYANELTTYIAAMADDQGCAILPELSAAVSALADTTAKFEHKLQKLKEKIGDRMSTFKHKKKLKRHLFQANERLASLESAFIDPVGLPGREWFRHAVYAPGLHNGYDTVMFPGVAEAMEDGGNPTFTREMEERAARVIDGVRSLLRGHHDNLVDTDDF